jgi:peroxiredoxin
MYRLLFLLLLPVYSLAQPPAASAFKFNSAVKITDPIEKVYFYYNDGEKNVVDSTVLKDNGFEFAGNVNEPTMATVRLKYLKQTPEEKQKYSTVQFFIEPGNASLVAGDSAGHFRVKAGKANDDYVKLRAKMLPWEQRMTPMYETYATARKNKDQAEIDRIEGELEKIDAAMKENVYATFLAENPKSPLALYVLKQYAGWDIDPKKIEPIYASLPEATRSWGSAVKFKDLLDISKKTAVGVKAMEFTQNDTAGMAVSLSSFRGKYVLVDFWASWCGPCRAENPNVVKAFNQFKDKGFTVLGVSLDNEKGKEKWLKAIHDDNLTWTQVSDLKYWDNAVAKQYGIRAIPQNILVGPDGVIVGKNLTGQKLVDKLNELLK